MLSYEAALAKIHCFPQSQGYRQRTNSVVESRYRVLLRLPEACRVVVNIHFQTWKMHIHFGTKSFTQLKIEAHALNFHKPGYKSCLLSNRSLPRESYMAFKTLRRVSESVEDKSASLRPPSRYRNVLEIGFTSKLQTDSEGEPQLKKKTF